MPIYVFRCGSCGWETEELLSLSSWNQPTIICPCGNMAERAVSRVTMRPDTAWSGIVDKNIGYITSDSQRNRILKERNLVEVGDRTDGEGMRKMAEEGARAKKDREAKERRQVLEDAFKGSGLLDSSGHIRPEAMKKISDERIMESQPKQEKITLSDS